MSEGPDWNEFLRLAQDVALLLGEGTPLTAKQITRELRRRGSSQLVASGVARALTDGADFHGFVRLPDNRWTISGNPGLD